MAKDKNEKSDEQESEFSENLLKMLACPVCSSNLRLSKDKKSLTCEKCGTVYEIKDGIPILNP